MKQLTATIVLVLLAASASFGGELPRIVFWEPYQLMIQGYYLQGLCQTDTTGLAPESYFAQLDSLGVTAAITYADSLASNNSVDMKIVGIEQSIVVDSDTLSELVKGAAIVLSEIEWVGEDTMNGAWWTLTGGTAVTDGYIWDPNVDNDGLILQSTGPKYGTPNSFRYMQSQFSMKTWNTVSTDTLCEIEVTYYGMSGWTTADKYIMGNDFASTNVWTDVAGPNFNTSGGHSFLVKVYWNWKDSLAFDKASFVDASFGAPLMALGGDDVDTAFDNFYTSIDSSNLVGWYPKDEPNLCHFWGVDFYDDHANSSGQNKRVLPALRGSLSYFVHDVSPDQLLVDNYTITTYHDSATNSNTSGSNMSIQLAYDALTDWVDGQYQEAAAADLPLIHTIQTGHQGTGYRDPTPNEMEVQVWLTLAHGARGIAYFPYSELFEGDCDTERDDLSVSVYPVPSDKANGSIFGGLVDWDFTNERYVPNSRWDAVRQVHDIIDDVWPILDTLSWIAVAPWDSADAMTGSMIDAIYSNDFSSDSVYVEVTRFLSADSIDTYMFVNRRSLSSDSQDVTINFANTTGAAIVTDITADTTYILRASSGGIVSLQEHFDPAEMKLFSIIPAYADSQSGTWAGSSYPIVGDIVVGSGETLSISSQGIYFASFDDITEDGVDSNRIEIICDGGELRIDGTAANRVIIDSDTSLARAWYGIRVLNDGHLFVDNAIIKGAQTGIRIENGGVDTILSTRIEDSHECGIYTDSCRFFMNYDTIVDAGYGLFVESTTGASYFWSGLVDGCTYGARLDNAELYIEKTEVSFDEYGNTATCYGLGTYGTSDIYLDECEFWNYYNGIRLYDSSYVEIDSCHFSSDIYDAATGYYPAMRNGIVGDYAACSCKVTLTCFEIIKNADVLRGDSGCYFDLGQASDSAENEFWYEQVGTGKGAIRIPVANVWNADWTILDTIMALNNYWDAGSAVMGLVDNSTQMTWRQPYCQAAPGGAKLTETTPGSDVLPLSFSVSQNYPNPFNPLTVIDFTLPEPCRVKLEVFNIMGQRVAIVTDQMYDAGIHSASWNGANDTGSPVASGVYLYRLSAGDNIVTRKMILMK